MSEHDPLCRWKPGILSFCECEVIAEVRADERERVHVTSTGLSGRTDYVQVRSEVLAVLRAKVESLPPHRARPSLWVRRVHVLELIDGEQR